ncbi:hypothetical protein DFH27DRAFT_645128 [Peziza echinospora]|nr:hypothetical protein DFH27DRAFT_645128 [Peziza echinospora]
MHRGIPWRWFIPTIILIFLISPLLLVIDAIAVPRPAVVHVEFYSLQSEPQLPPTPLFSADAPSRPRSLKANTEDANITPTLQKRHQVSSNRPDPGMGEIKLEEHRWQSGPKRRGTFSILFSCTITIGLAAWPAVLVNVQMTGGKGVQRGTKKDFHPNRNALEPVSIEEWDPVKCQAAHEKEKLFVGNTALRLRVLWLKIINARRFIMRSWVHKVVWAVLSVVMPELSLLMAVSEYQLAERLLATLRQLDAETKKQTFKDWDLSMTYYVLMGGFYLEIKEDDHDDADRSNNPPATRDIRSESGGKSAHRQPNTGMLDTRQGPVSPCTDIQPAADTVTGNSKANTKVPKFLWPRSDDERNERLDNNMHNPENIRRRAASVNCTRFHYHKSNLRMDQKRARCSVCHKSRSSERPGKPREVLTAHGLLYLACLSAYHNDPMTEPRYQYDQTPDEPPLIVTIIRWPFRFLWRLVFPSPQKSPVAPEAQSKSSDQPTEPPQTTAYAQTVNPTSSPPLNRPPELTDAEALDWPGKYPVKPWYAPILFWKKYGADNKGSVTPMFNHHIPEKNWITSDEALRLHDEFNDMNSGLLSDMSKGDFITKMLLVTQGSWMIIQVISRVIGGKPIVLLELHAAARIAIGVVQYMYWWHKPVGIMLMSPLTITRTQYKLMMNTETWDETNDLRVERSHRELLLRQDLNKEVLDQYVKALEEKRKLGYDREREGRAISSESAAETMGPKNGAEDNASRLTSLKEWWRELVHLEADESRNNYYTTSQATLGKDTYKKFKNPARKTEAVRSTTSMIVHIIFSLHRWPATAIIWYGSVLAYGGIHLCAWDWYFPTPWERLIWNSVTLITTGAITVWVGMIFIIAVSILLLEYILQLAISGTTTPPTATTSSTDTTPPTEPTTNGQEQVSHAPAIIVPEKHSTTTTMTAEAEEIACRPTTSVQRKPIHPAVLWIAPPIATGLKILIRLVAILITWLIIPWALTRLFVLFEAYFSIRRVELGSYDVQIWSDIYPHF